MESPTTQQILSLFNPPSKSARRNLNSLLNDAFSALGEATALEKMEQWQTLSKKLNTSNKLVCLGDLNHRRLIIEFMREDSISLYNNSYFNRAKIDKQFVEYLRQIKPYLFAQTLTIVNKLKLISEHFKEKLECKRFSQNHVDMKIIRILEMCSAKERSINSNLKKFKSIVQFEEDREELIKELGKMLRTSWVCQKRKKKHLEVQNQLNENISQMGSSIRDFEHQSSEYSAQNSDLEVKGCEYASE